MLKMNIDPIVYSSRAMEAPPQPTLGSAHLVFSTGLNIESFSIFESGR